MMARIREVEVPDGEQSVRIKFPNGSSFVLRQRGEGRYRFTAENCGDVSLQSFYGQGVKGESVNLLFTIARETE